MKLFLHICLIAVLVATVCICAIKPDMHKTVLVYNSDYTPAPEEEVKLEKTQIPSVEMPAQPQTQTVQKKVETVGIPKTQTNSQKIKTTSNLKQAPVKTTVKKVVQQPQQTTVKEETKAPLKSLQTQSQKQIQTQTQPKVLTQKEEEIAWNIWRSNLQNQIMRDVKLPAIPNGVVFRFTFSVDKYGKITNIYTSSDNPAFTPYAIQYIAPVIRSYQGKSILNFPTGSTRTSTEVKGGWKISSSERLSTPQDYNDYEKILRQN